MNQSFFWLTWQKPYKQLYWCLLGLFVSAIIFFLVGWIMGVDVTFPWETYAHRETIKLTIDTVKSGPFKLPLEIESYLLTESFQGGDLTIYKWPAYLFVIVLAIIFTLAIACITTLKRFWYLIGMGLIIVFLMNLQLENLQMFGQYNKSALIGVFVCYLPLSYYYQFINSNPTFPTRALVFASITAFTGCVIYFGAEVQYPFLYVATYGYTAPVILSLLFIAMIGHQILTGFMYIITKNNNVYSKNSLTHFLLISSIYLINLTMVVLNEIKYLHWELFNFHPFALLLISSLIGILLYSLREDTYKHIYRFYPIGGFAYIMLGSICFFTIGYYLFSANDSIIEVFEDFILYAHLGYGFIFLIYILANFMTPLKGNMQVYRVLYSPQYMPYFTYRFAGTIMITAFVLVSNYQIPIFHAMAAYYNAIGDLHTQTGDSKVAKLYYKKGTQYDYRNHRANYTLGTMFRNEGDNVTAAYYFNEAIQKRPTPQSYINMGNIYLEEGKFFDGLFTIRDGMDKFSDSDRIKVNLGLLYEKANESDSAFFVFEAGRNHAVTERSANVNTLYLINKGGSLYDPDSIINEYVVEDHTAMLSNAFVLFNASQQFWNKPMYLDTILNIVTGSALYNQSINHIYNLDSTYLKELYALALSPKNIAFREQLLFATALGYYHHQEVALAYQLMDQLANNNPQKSGYYLYVQGLWSLDQKAPLLAVDYFEKSQSRNYPKAKLALGIASMEAGLIDKAKEHWTELSLDEDPINKQMAMNALQVLSYDLNPNRSDADKYWYWKYQVSKDNEILTQEVIESIADENYKSQIYIDLMSYFLDKEDTAKVMFYSNYKLLDTNNTPLKTKWDWLEIRKNDFLGKIDSASYMLAFKSTNPTSNQLMKLYYHARFVVSKGDTTKANALFEKMAANPFFEQGVIGKANYLSQKGTQMKAYNILLDALEINPYAINLRKQYIMQCAIMDFDRYAEYALEELRPLVSGQEYYIFRSQYEEKLKTTQQDSEYFEN